MDVSIDTGRALLVVVLTVAAVIVINVAIYFVVANKNNVGQIHILRKATSRARDPWQDEDASLAELSRLVAKLKEDRPPDQEATNPPDTQK